MASKNHPPIESQKVLSLIWDLHSSSTLNQLAEVSVEGLADLFRSVDVKWVEFTSDWKRILWSCTAASDHKFAIHKHLQHVLKETSTTGDLYNLLQSFVKEEIDTFCCLADFYSARTLQNLPIYRKFMKPMGIKENICFQGHYTQGGGAVIISLCQKIPLNSDQLECLNQVRKHIRLAAARISRSANLTNLATVLGRSRKDGIVAGVALIIDENGTLGEVDETSAELIKNLGGFNNKEQALVLPNRVKRWAEDYLADHARLAAQTGGVTKIFYSWEGHPIEVHLLLQQAGSGAIISFQKLKSSDHHTSTYDLTPKELEVIRGISAELNSQDVALSIGVSKRTVDKHLENIYQKMSVQDRIAASEKFQALHIEPLSKEKTT